MLQLPFGFRKTENKGQFQDNVESLVKDFFRHEGIYSFSVHVQVSATKN